MSSFRITTNGLFRNYRSNLYKNNNTLSKAMTTVQTERNFNTYAEDPAAASKAWRLRRSFWRTNDQIDNSNYLISKYESASQAMHAIVDGDAGNGIYGLNGILSAVEGLSDTSGSSRNALGKELVQTAENMVSVMNSKYGEDFVFAGADGANIPFSWDGGKLLYRGLHVGVEQPKALSEFGLTEADLQGVKTTELDMAEPVAANYPNGASDPAYLAAKEKYDTAQTLMQDERVQELKKYADDYASRNGLSYETGKEEYTKLQNLADEATYIDIGLGMQEDENGELITGSAFNSSISGLKFLGYGKDQNLAEVVRELGEIFQRADPDTGYYADTDDADRASELLDKLHDAVGASQRQHVQLEADAKYLNTNLDQLKTNKDQLNTQINDTERMDMADAITQMTWAKYCYDAALRIGTNILSQSLLDYMS